MPDWFWIPFETFINLLEISLTIYLANGLFQKREISAFRWLTLGFVVAGTSWLTLYMFVDVPFSPDIFPVTVVFIAYSLTCLKASWYMATIASLVNIVTLGILAYSVPAFIGRMMNIPQDVFYELENPRILSILISHIIWIALIAGVTKMMHRRKSLQFMQKGRMLFFSIPLFSLFLILLLLQYGQVSHSTNIPSLFSVMIGIGLLVINVGALYVFDQMTQQAEQTIILQAQNSAERMQLRHQEEVQGLYQNIRKFRHDYNSYVHTMQGMLEMGKIEELKAYLENLSGHLTELTEFISTGNVVTDALLSVQMDIAKSHGIDASLEADLREASLVTDEHLCVLLGNLFDNAYEACLRISDTAKRFIRFKIHMQKENLYILIENSTDGVEKKINNRWVTTKGSAHGHGFGLLSIDGIVDMYGGFCERSHEQNTFKTSIVLPLARIK